MFNIEQISFTNISFTCLKALVVIILLLVGLVCFAESKKSLKPSYIVTTEKDITACSLEHNLPPQKLDTKKPLGVSNISIFKDRYIPVKQIKQKTLIDYISIDSFGSKSNPTPAVRLVLNSDFTEGPNAKAIRKFRLEVFKIEKALRQNSNKVKGIPLNAGDEEPNLGLKFNW